MAGKHVPEVTTLLRKNYIKMPDAIKKASGINIIGKKIKAILFSTDIAVIKNSNADAVIAVYPFTPNPSITQAILSVADVPVFMGCGGGITGGARSANVALHAEFQGGIGVVFNAPTSLETLKKTRATVDIPIVLTVVSNRIRIQEKLEVGVDIFNVSGGSRTSEIVRLIRKELPDFPIIATGGPSEASILETIEAGANAITYTPPPISDMLKGYMEDYRARLLG